MASVSLHDAVPNVCYKILRERLNIAAACEAQQCLWQLNLGHLHSLLQFDLFGAHVQDG